jgi:hypothetical protein
LVKKSPTLFECSQAPAICRSFFLIGLTNIHLI